VADDHESVDAGDLLQVRITRANKHSLVGEPLEPVQRAPRAKPAATPRGRRSLPVVREGVV
jgi:hypothetical protein